MKLGLKQNVSKISPPNSPGPRKCRICFQIEDSFDDFNDDNIKNDLSEVRLIDKSIVGKTTKNEFISPCKCSGSMAWVHTECLHLWRTTSARRDSFSRCEQCFTPYRMRMGRTGKFLSSPITSKFCTFILLLCSMSAAIIIATGILQVHSNGGINGYGFQPVCGTFDSKFMDMQANQVDGHYIYPDYQIYFNMNFFIEHAPYNDSSQRPKTFNASTRNEKNQVDYLQATIQEISSPTRDANELEKSIFHSNLKVTGTENIGSSGDEELKQKVQNKPDEPKSIISNHQPVNDMKLKTKNKLISHNISGKRANFDHNYREYLPLAAVLPLAIALLAGFSLVKDGSQGSCLLASALLFSVMALYVIEWPWAICMYPVPAAYGLVQFVHDLQEAVDDVLAHAVRQTATDIYPYRE